MKKLFYLIIIAISYLLSIPAVILIMAYEKGKARVDNIKAHTEKFNRKNK